MTALALGASVLCLAVAYLMTLAMWQRRRLRGLELQLQAATADLQRLQESCASLAPGDLVDRMITEDPPQSAETREVTALFVDLVGFTALSESLSPDVLLRVLNGYIEHMSAAVENHRGHVSTYLGDGILAYFGALEPNPWQCNDAAETALAMRDALSEYNAALYREGLPELAIGIGLHHGKGLVGMIGTPERMEFAFVGRTVNIAARLQELTRQQDADILLSEAVRSQLAPTFEVRLRPQAQLKGISKPVSTYALVGRRDPQVRSTRKA